MEVFMGEVEFLIGLELIHELTSEVFIFSVFISAN